jgi:hypothetical protein
MVTENLIRICDFGVDPNFEMAACTNNISVVLDSDTYSIYISCLFFSSPGHRPCELLSWVSGFTKEIFLQSLVALVTSTH